MARGLSASLAQRGGTLTMRLTPESLGAMRIQMDVQQGVVNVSMDVSNPQAHRLLMESIDTLRSSLEARGLAVEKIGVNLTPGSLGSSGIGGAGSVSHAGSGNFGNGSSGTGDQNAQRQDANGQGFANHDAGDGRSRSWLGGDQREHQRSPGGAAAHASDRTDAEVEDFGGLWQRLRLGVDTRV
ncbi:MAG: flagellar hook-length control protein FliK [Phycisphaerales bacterium]